MNIDSIKQVYLIGIGGIGMSGLARYFQHVGCVVAGYDRTETVLTKQLVAAGIDVTYTDDFKRVDDVFKDTAGHTLVIYTPAVPGTLQILQGFRQLGHVIWKRSEVLGLISERRFTIAVAGTHGKTTTSTLIAHILKASGYDCSAFLGGISSNYNTNVLFSERKENNTWVVEADEYDRSFLTLHPDIAVVTSADADHLDIYGDESHVQASFVLFLRQVKNGGTRIVKASLSFQADIRYALEPGADVYADAIRIADGAFFFDYVTLEERISNIRLGIPGRHNVENAVAAITVARKLGIGVDDIVDALASFTGVKRRFEYIVNTPRIIYIDDYAHHPEELRAFLSAVRQLYPSRKLTAIFQPHLFSRTRDFADDFAQVLSLVDVLILMDIYPARELPIPGIDSQMLLENVTISEKYLFNSDQIKVYIQEHQPELLVTMGAGDIDLLVAPLKMILTHG